jgi:hypothetical protein
LHQPKRRLAIRGFDDPGTGLFEHPATIATDALLVVHEASRHPAG